MNFRVRHCKAVHSRDNAPEWSRSLKESCCTDIYWLSTSSLHNKLQAAVARKGQWQPGRHIGKHIIAKRVSQWKCDQFLQVPFVFNNPKAIEMGKMKAQDYRNVTCFMAFAVINGIRAINTAAMRTIRVWALWCYITRLYRLPAEEFMQHTEASIRKVLSTFLDAWIAAFGKRTCVYNIHVAAAHLLEVISRIFIAASVLHEIFQIRGENGGSDKSAYRFEHSYSKTRRAYAPGTDNICLQIIRGNQLYLKSSESHWCRRKGMPKPKTNKSQRKDDAWFYSFARTEDSTRPVYRFYRMLASKHYRIFIAKLLWP